MTLQPRQSLLACALRIVLGGLSFTVADAALGVEIQSATHFGMAAEQRSSTGFERSVGSAVFLDGSLRLWPRVDLGWRTMGFGASQDGGQFYRLGVGPLITGHITERWSMDLCPFYFSESARGEDGEVGYSSKGSAVLAGWHRRTSLSERIDLSWGGFVSWYWGNMAHAPEAGRSDAAQARWAGVSRNEGMSRGVEIALRVRL